ncbi:MAG: TolC family protein [Bacteroidales bacterium]|nr:TolC family protein [Bacteroidales bacterium]
MRKGLLSAFIILLTIVFRLEAGDSISISMERLFELADSRSKSIKAYEAVAKQTEEEIKVAKSARMPDIGISLSASYLGNVWLADRNFKNGQNEYMPHFGNNFAIEASQVIYAGGAIQSGVAASKLRHDIALQDAERNRQDVRFLAAGFYLELARLNNEVIVYRKNIEQTKQVLEDITARQKEGLALKNDITRYELMLKSLELALTQTLNRVAIINDKLITLVDLPDGSIIVTDSAILELMPKVDGEEYWQECADNSSPILKMAKSGVELSEKNEKIVRSEMIPSLALFAADKLDGPITIEVPPIDKNLNYWYVGIGLKYNLSSAYKSNKKRNVARVATTRARWEEEIAKDNLESAIKEAYIEFEEAFTIYATQVKSLELATENYRVINERYSNGLVLITEMLDASNQKLDAELDVSNAKINILFKYYKLGKTAGTL